jgi:hypothetical protein
LHESSPSVAMTPTRHQFPRDRLMLRDSGLTVS